MSKERTDVNKIAIIGHFGGTKKFTDGQTVKTINLYKELALLTNWNIKIVDTYFKFNQPIKFLKQLLVVLISTKNIIILLSSNGMRVFFPLLYIWSVVFRRNVYHDVIGGSMAMIVESHPKYKKYLNSFCVNWVETNFLKRELEQQGIQNVAVVPNFRRVETLSEKDLNSGFSEPFVFCTFSRVIKEKGIEEAIFAIQKVNRIHGREVCRLDIYGPVGEEYKERFETVMKQSDSCVRYCGEVPSDKAVETLRNYYATLFPTHWIAESNAGTVTESLFAGVPVIATDWRCNPEMITTGYNGIIYPGEVAKTLEEAIQKLINDCDRIMEIKRNCLESARQYQPDMCMKQIIEFIERTNTGTD